MFNQPEGPQDGQGVGVALQPQVSIETQTIGDLKSRKSQFEQPSQPNVPPSFSTGTKWKKPPPSVAPPTPCQSFSTGKKWTKPPSNGEELRQPSQRLRGLENVNGTVLFMGNPGAGKSTLLNCLARTELFDGGLSETGGGLTKKFEIQIKRGVIYMDSPGLNDVDQRETCARQISLALQTGGRFLIFFVIALENGGRVKPDNFETIKQILEGAPDIKNRYSVIFNRAPQILFDHHIANPTISQGWFSPDKVPYPPSAYYWFPFCERLLDNDGLVVPPVGYTEFIENAPDCVINPENVKTMDGLTDAQRTRLSELQHQADALRAIVALHTPVNIILENCKLGERTISIPLASPISSLHVLGRGAYGFMTCTTYAWFMRCLGDHETLHSCGIKENDRVYFRKKVIGPTGPLSDPDLNEG